MARRRWVLLALGAVVLIDLVAYLFGVWLGEYLTNQA